MNFIIDFWTTMRRFLNMWSSYVQYRSVVHKKLHRILEQNFEKQGSVLVVSFWFFKGYFLALFSVIFVLTKCWIKNDLNSYRPVTHKNPPYLRTHALVFQNSEIVRTVEHKNLLYLRISHLFFKILRFKLNFKLLKNRSKDM